MDNESILISIKKMLGMDPDYIQFDTDIIIDINSVLMVLNQLGIGPTVGFSITGPTEQWMELVQDRKDVDAIKTYIYLKVKLMFDPPTNSSLIQSIDNQIKEYEWRLNVQAESTIVEGGTTSG